MFDSLTRRGNRQVFNVAVHTRSPLTIIKLTLSPLTALDLKGSRSGLRERTGVLIGPFPKCTYMIGFAVLVDFALLKDLIRLSGGLAKSIL